MKIKHDVTDEEREVTAAEWKELVEGEAKRGHPYSPHPWTIIQVGPAEILPHHSDREIERRWRTKWDVREREYAVQTNALLKENQRHQALATSILYAVVGYGNLKTLTVEKSAEVMHDALLVHQSTGGNFEGAVRAVMTLRDLWRKGSEPEEEDGNGTDEWHLDERDEF